MARTDSGASPDASPPGTAYSPQQITQAYSVNSINFSGIVGVSRQRHSAR
jgi:hypothetical protein